MLDLIVVGGGATGLGIAWSAAERGLSVILLEKGRIASGTSANMLGIIHGGFRYLQSLDVPRVLESIRAQTLLLAKFPQFVKPLSCVMPLSNRGLKSRLPIGVALKVFEALTKCTQISVPLGGLLTNDAAAALATELKEITPYGALRWWDAIVNEPQSLAKAISEEIIANGGVILENSAVSEISYESGGLVVVGEKERWTAKNVVNAAGPGAQSIKLSKKIAGGRTPTPYCRAFNITVRKRVCGDQAVGISGEGGRLFFYVPRSSGGAIGTEYLSALESGELSISEEEKSQFFDAASRAFPGAQLTPDMITGVELGALPVRKARGTDLIKHPIVFRKRGYIEVVATKYTTLKTFGDRMVKSL